MLGRTNTGGGSGGGLNFKVVGNPQPPSPKENTIWLNTDEKITCYIFSATEPEEPVPGMVWISVGTASDVAFSATKKNPIMIYPLFAKQYISGAWIELTAKSYQNGAWVEWITYLFNNGDECADVTGGWESVMVSDNCTLTKEITADGAMRMTAKAGATHRRGYFYTAKEIDLSSADYVHFNITEYYISNDSNAHSICISPLNAMGTPVAQAEITGVGEMSINVAELDGAYSVLFFLGGSASGQYTTVATNPIWLE